MKRENLFTFFNSRFVAVSRPLREQILCAMIRVNYGTSWDGDLDLLKNFFPEWYHRSLVLGGLSSLIETFSPSSDEPTDPGIVVEEPTLNDFEITAGKTADDTASFGEVTTDVPQMPQGTISLKVNLS